MTHRVESGYVDFYSVAFNVKRSSDDALWHFIALFINNGFVIDNNQFRSLILISSCFDCEKDLKPRLIVLYSVAL